ncbi:MAG: hypothetical protein KAJ18_01255 [Candidatus Omnitrophica bacterium]|nr:hypothetical protein [Candidatus Omnitrophota bacterium]
MNIQNKKYLYLVENLTVPVFLFTVVPFLLKRQNKQGEGKCVFYYIDATHLGLYLSKGIFFLCGLSIEKLNFRLIDVRADNGQLMRLKISYEKLAQVQKDILLNDPLLQEVFRVQQQNNPRFCVYLQKQSVGFAWFAQDTTWRILFLIHVGRWFVKQKLGEEYFNIIFAYPRFGKKELLDYAQGYQTDIVFSKFRKFSVKRVFAYFLGETFSRNLYYHATAFFQKLLKDKPDGSLSEMQGDGPKLMVEYCGFLNLDRPENISDLFFFGKSGLKGQDILMTFNLPADPLDEQKFLELQRQQIGCVALNPKASRVPQVPLFLNSLGQRADLMDPLFLEIKDLKKGNGWRGSKETRAWLLEQTRNFEQEYRYWYDFFVKNNVKAYISWYNWDTRHCIISHALNRVGGVSAIYQRSHEEMGCPELTVAVDLAFGFSSMGYEAGLASNSYIPYYVIVGYIGDYRFPLLKDPAREGREHLMKNGAKRIFAYLDENSIDDARWHSGHEFMRENYIFILNKVLENPEIGLILKPKVSETLVKRLGEVSKLLDAALATGRCYIFDKCYPTAIAGFAADVVVHGHAMAVSAGLEPALNGVPTLLLDREGWPVSKMYKFGKGKIVFDAWEDLWTAMEEHWRMPGRGVSGFGDWSPVINDFDPFRDGRAVERVSTYFEWILDGHKAGLSKDTILADAAQRYKKLWGEDKVRTVDTFKTFCNNA